MADWKFLALVFIALGFEMDVLALVNYNIGIDYFVVSTEICAFLLFLAVLLLMILIKFGELHSSRVAVIVTIVLIFIAAGLILLGLVFFRGGRGFYDLPPYPSTLLVCAAAFGILGGVFLIVDTCRCC